jgi:chemotaxis protein CheD
MRKILWKAGVIVHKEEVGGNSSRTVSIDVATGRVQLRTSGEPEKTMQIKSQTPAPTFVSGNRTGA